MGYKDYSVMRNMAFIEFHEELKSYITKDLFLELLTELGDAKEIKEYYNALLTAALDKCKEVRWNTFTPLQKHFIDTYTKKYVMLIIEECLPEKFGKKVINA